MSPGCQEIIEPGALGALRCANDVDVRGCTVTRRQIHSRVALATIDLKVPEARAVQLRLHNLQPTKERLMQALERASAEEQRSRRWRCKEQQLHLNQIWQYDLWQLQNEPLVVLDGNSHESVLVSIQHHVRPLCLSAPTVITLSRN